jgi:hypothetical protein
MDLNLPLDENIIRRFDSFSNAFYVLYVQAGYNRLPPTEGPMDNLSMSIISRRVIDCSDDKLIQVPTIDMLALPTEDGLDVSVVTFTIVDVIDWSNATRCDAFNQCIPTGLVPESDTYVTEITLTQPECNFNSVLNANGTSLLQKCRNMNSSIVSYVIQYTYIRWVLSSLLFGSFKLKYLHRDFTTKFMTTLARSRFNLFYSEYFNSLSLIDDNGLLYDVVGYGNVPQNGQFYFI